MKRRVFRVRRIVAANPEISRAGLLSCMEAEGIGGLNECSVPTILHDTKNTPDSQRFKLLCILAPNPEIGEIDLRAAIEGGGSSWRQAPCGTPVTTCARQLLPANRRVGSRRRRPSLRQRRPKRRPRQGANRRRSAHLRRRTGWVNCSTLSSAARRWPSPGTARRSRGWFRQRGASTALRRAPPRSAFARCERASPSADFR